MLLVLLLAATPMGDWKAISTGVEYRTFVFEGGPEARLSIRPAVLKVDLCGSFETGSMPSDQDVKQCLCPM